VEAAAKNNLPEDSSMEEDEDDNGTVVVNDVEDEVGDDAVPSTIFEGARYANLKWFRTKRPKRAMHLILVNPC
jgi:hypothetical protein